MLDDTGGSIVESTVLALVHEGERIMPAPGSAAAFGRGIAGGADIHFHFPIEVVVVGELPEEARNDMEARIWTALHEALG